MKFILSWTVKPENRNESLKRLNAKDKVAGEGIRILGHWHNVNLLGGWALMEADNETSIAKLLLDWTDLNVNDVSLVIDEEERRSITQD
jgi:hypothetical protein